MDESQIKALKEVEKELNDLMDYFENAPVATDEEIYIIQQGLQCGRWADGTIAKKIAERDVERWKTSKVN